MHIDDTIFNLRKKLDDKQFSTTELVEHYIDRIKQYNPKLNAVITPTFDSAIKQAKKTDQSNNKPQGLLSGIPILHKDIFCTKGVRTSCGSKYLDNFISPYDATLVEKSNKHNLIMLGKTNLDEFCMGSSTETSYYGRTANPWNLKCTPGGSSGGSAAAVAARLAPFATGTDTGGSIRQPASFCGITGVKPTYGRVSRFGMVAYASSLDQGGVLARSAEEASALLQALSGHDPKDSTSLNKEVFSNLDRKLNLKGTKIGMPKEFFSNDLNPEIKKVLEHAIKQYENLGAEIVDISLPNIKLALPAYYIIAPAEASANLSRYDGVRYGYRCKNPVDLMDLYERSRSESFGDEVKRRILVGAYVLSSGYYDAYYLKAQKIRRLISNDFQSAFKKCDVIASPVTPTTAFKLGTKTNDPTEMYLSDIYTIPVNLAGLPALSQPAGFLKGMPVGLQLIANHYEETKMLSIAHQYQLVTDWHIQQPTAYEGK
ncbi:MAG: aspartyl-tRNA(Asn)/glutamyl-tRNA(Gln) amidotransferase subunit A [Francisellaceae bacterium]|jgi:aspartyl-tRNA(Asn)/glutamyl-tRNA(Gln) amidotransferase subunit A